MSISIRSVKVVGCQIGWKRRKIRLSRTSALNAGSYFLFGQNSLQAQNVAGVVALITRQKKEQMFLYRGSLRITLEISAKSQLNFSGR